MLRTAIAVLLFVGLSSGQSGEELLREALKHLESGRVEQAIEQLEAVVERRPNDGRALLGLAEAYRQAGREADAEEQLDRVRELASRQPLLLRGLSVYYEQKGDPAQAAQYEAGYARAFPDDVSGLGRAAALYLDAGDFQRAAEFAESALERARLVTLFEILGKARLGLGDAGGAEEAFQAAVEERPYDEDARYNLAYFYLQAQRFDEALRAFEAARAVFDKSPRIELGLGAAYYGLRRFDEATEAFLRASELAPAAPQPHYFLSRMIEHAPERIPQILERQRRFAQLQPDHYLGPFLEAQALLAGAPPQPDEALLEQAERLLRRSIELRDDFWESHFELGLTLEKRRRYEQARTAFERAAELNPQASKPYYRLARIYARLGLTEQAAEARRRHAELVEAERAAMARAPAPLEIPEDR